MSTIPSQFSLDASLQNYTLVIQTSLYLPKDRFHINLMFSENLSTFGR